MLEDLRFAVRVLAKKPGFSLVAILTLALGLGAGSSMFSIVHSLLLRPLDLPDLDRLTLIQERSGGNQFHNELPPREFLDLRDEARSFTDIAAYQWWNVAITGDGDPEQQIAFQTAPGFFDIIGQRPILGRWFASDEIDGKNDHVVVLSHELWTRRYGSDPAILGKPVTVNRESYAVVGVMPPDFRFPYAASLWAPMTLTPEQRADRGSTYLGVVGRLRPGATVAEADAELRQLGERHAGLYAERAGHALRVVPLARGITEDFTRDFIYTLAGAAVFLLLLVCANVANLFLAHALSRRRELAVRAALGAGRGRIVRMLVTEAVLLGLAGGLGSLLVASWSVDVIHGMMPAATTRFIPGWDRLGVDGAVLAFAIGAGVLAGIVFGVFPALQVSRTGDVNGVLKDGDRGTTSGRTSHRLRSALVVVQVTLALCLLLAGGALSSGFARLAAPSTSVDARGVLTLNVTLPESRYARPADALELERRVLERLQALPGVEAAAAASNIPWSGNNTGRLVAPEGREIPRGDDLVVDYRAASPGFLELLRVPRLEGRMIAASDGADAPRVALVSISAARLFWPDGTAVGKRFHFGREPSDKWITVVGVVGDINDKMLSIEPKAAVYVPFAQAPRGDMYFALRTAGDPMALARAARTSVYAVDPSQPVEDVLSLEMVQVQRLAGIGIGAKLMAAFALLALFLAAIGIYAVIATLVAQRTHEIGVRMALGAGRRNILALVLGKGAVVTGADLAVGLGLGALLVHVMAGMLFSIVATSAALFVVITATVAAVALLGSLLPAWRATRVDPLVALREE